RIRKANARRCRAASAEGDGSAAPRHKTATVERREASVPRDDTPHGCRCTRTFLGARPTPRFGVGEAQLQTPGAENAPRERDGLFDMVSWAEMRCCPHPEERACRRRSANAKPRARVSKDEDGQDAGPSCFETHRSAAESAQASVFARAAMLLSMRTERILAK